MSEKEKANLAYDGECFVCRELANNISHEFNVEPVPVQNLYDKYGLEHDAYLIIDGRRYKGYSWVVPYIFRYGFKKLFISLLLASNSISKAYHELRREGRHPIPYLGHGKILLKVSTLFLSLYFLKPIYSVWIKIWRD